MVADELNRDLAAALIRDVGELRADRLFHRDRNDLVFLLGAGAAHFHRAFGRLFLRIDEVFHVLVRLLGVDPEHEFVERQHRDRSEVLPVERNARRQRSREQVRQRDDDLVRVSADALTSRKPSPPAPPDLLITTIGCFIRLCLVMMPWIVRAIWSAPPPVPAGMMNSTGREGSHAADAGIGEPRQPPVTRRQGRHISRIVSFAFSPVEACSLRSFGRIWDVAARRCPP